MAPLGPEAVPLNELLAANLEFVLSREDDSTLTAVPGFLRSIRREPRLAIHLDDLLKEADDLGRNLRDEEYDGGNPGELIDYAYDHLGDDLKSRQAIATRSQLDGRFRRLLADFNHPFVLPLPSSSDEALGRVSKLLSIIDQLATVAFPQPVGVVEEPGFRQMAARNAALHRRARLATRGEPAVALLRLEAVARLAVGDTPLSDSAADRERPALRVEADRSAALATRALGEEVPSDATQARLRPVVEDVHHAARLVALELRRRLYGVRSRIGVVLRFKARCEWHDRERLRRLIDEETAAGRKPEHVLRDELTLYLFDQGLNPLAETVLGTFARADVFDPTQGPSFYVEAKQYSDRAGIESELRAAFRQALDTVGNLRGSGYFADEAFVVLFRRGGPRAVLPTEPFSAEGLRWYFALVNIAEAAHDASQNRETPEEYTPERLRDLLFKPHP